MAHSRAINAPHRLIFRCMIAPLTITVYHPRRRPVAGRSWGMFDATKRNLGASSEIAMSGRPRPTTEFFWFSVPDCDRVLPWAKERFPIYRFPSYERRPRARPCRFPMGVLCYPPLGFFIKGLGYEVGDSAGHWGARVPGRVRAGGEGDTARNRDRPVRRGRARRGRDDHGGEHRDQPLRGDQRERP